jgi:hypothetical protein
VVINLVEHPSIGKALRTWLPEKVVRKAEVKLAHCVQSAELFLTKGDVKTVQVVFQLCRASCADDGNDDTGLLPNPRERNLGGRTANLLRNPDDLGCDGEIAFTFSAFILRHELLGETPNPIQVERIGESEHQLLHASFL